MNIAAAHDRHREQKTFARAVIHDPIAAISHGQTQEIPLRQNLSVNCRIVEPQQSDRNIFVARLQYRQEIFFRRRAGVSFQIFRCQSKFRKLLGESFFRND